MFNVQSKEMPEGMNISVFFLKGTKMGADRFDTPGKMYLD